MSSALTAAAWKAEKTLGVHSLMDTMGLVGMDRSRQPAEARPPRRSRLAVLLAIMLGVAAGIGTYTFRYAEGLSYLSDDPRACVNCHIMEPQYAAWQQASHHALAKCVDCHLPRPFFERYLVKAENGWRHGKLFTTQTFAEPIFVQDAGLRVLQGNCVACHGALIHDMAPGVAEHDTSMPCIHCHASVGHGARAGLGGPLRADELMLESTSPEKGRSFDGK